ncbi:MAG TPA: histidinol-phosphate transaminase [Terriglobales bacterium]|jgi:histidinol-phosphate aminotransferase|nr:histidinol-phosphate transaminase [Terriglobales bacterium]
MPLSRRRFVQASGGLASALVTLPLTAGTLASFANAAEASSNTPVRLDSNENAYGPSPKVVAAMQDALSMANRYPRPEYSGLVQRIASMHKVEPKRVLLGCGSSEILRVAAVASLGPGKKFVQPSPTFETAGNFAKLAGADVISVPLDKQFAHDLDAMLGHIDANTPLVYICNPNNPTGSITPRDALERFIAKVPATTIVLIDEAYHHFALESAGYRSFLDDPINDGRVVVSRTFSKVYGLAGMRLGYAIATPELVARLRPYITPVNVNAVVLRAAFAALGDTDYEQQCIARNASARQEFFTQAATRGLKPVPCATNFCMMDVGRPTKQVVEYFRSKNVWIGREFPPLTTYIRVSLGKPEEMKEFWRVYDLQAHAA